MRFHPTCSQKTDPLGPDRKCVACPVAVRRCTAGEGRGLIHRAEEGFLRCLAAPPRPHAALPGAAARDCGHLGAPTPRGPVAFPLPAAVLPDARPRPLHMSPEHPPRGEMVPESPLHSPAASTLAWRPREKRACPSACTYHAACTKEVNYLSYLQCIAHSTEPGAVRVSPQVRPGGEQRRCRSSRSA